MTPESEESKGDESIGLREEDWNFQPLAQADNQELQVTVFWEYLRESKSVKELCRRWLDLLRAGKTPENDAETQEAVCQLQRITARMGRGGFDVCQVAEPLSKDTPWLILDKHLRRELVGRSFRSPHDPLPSNDSVGVYFIPDEPVMLGSVTHLRTEFSEEEIKRGEDLDYRGEIDAFGAETLPLRISWRRFSNDELIEGFEGFVKHYRPSSEPEPEPWKSSKGKGKGTTYYAQLTDLGTMRLLHVKPPLEVLKIIHAADQSKLMRAAWRARARFKELLGSKEEPLRGRSLSKRKGRK
jgi:hypothetical protein